MPAVSGDRQYRCHGCARGFTSQGRRGHHWAADHAPKTSTDIPKTSLIMARTRHEKPKGSGTLSSQRSAPRNRQSMTRSYP